MFNRLLRGYLRDPEPAPAGGGAPAAGGGAGAPGAGNNPDPAVELARLKAENDALKGQVDEGKRTAQFWYDKANKPAESARPTPTADDEPDVDVLELAAKGGKQFSNYLNDWAKKNGFVKADEVDARVNNKAALLVKEQELTGRFPDLKKKDSEFFQTAAQHFGTFKAAGIPEHLAMELAAEKTELELMRAGKIKTPQQRADDDKAERERVRLARIAAQSGDRGGRGTQADEEDEELTPEQERIAIRMLAGDAGPDGKPMTNEQAIEAYKARAKKGVAMRGRG